MSVMHMNEKVIDVIEILIAQKADLRPLLLHMELHMEDIPGNLN